MRPPGGSNPQAPTRSRLPAPFNIADSVDVDTLGSLDEIKESVERQIATAQPASSTKTAAQEKADPRSKKDYAFDVDYTDARGVRWQGHFVNRIPNIATRQKIAIAQARMNGGLAQDLIDSNVADLNWVLAYLTFSLTESPPWAKNLLELDDPAVVYAVWAEVAAHEATFRGLGAAPQAGEGSSSG